MGNPLRNAMVYLGLAEDDDENQSVPDTRERQQAIPTENVEPAPRQERPAPVTPINRAAAEHVTPKPTPQPKPTPTPSAVGAMNEILTVHPKAYDKDAQLIAESFRDGVPVIMNLSQMTDSDARRIIDFASGLTQGLLGKIERVTNRVFLLTPEHVNVHGEDTGAQNEDPTFFA
ncbi:MAG: cell division protein SepF [Gulosibacter sp.]|uniref:cell division protein SepF n=1 Tax=Gulosibacter sp. TaxID=2817531 RepID=UPI003F929178